MWIKIWVYLPLPKAKFVGGKKTEQRFDTLYKQKLSNLRPLLSMTFPQEFRKSNKIGHFTLGSGGKKMFKRSEQMKKRKNCIKLFLPRRFYTLYEQKFSNLRPILSITFPQGFRKFKMFGHLTLGSGGKKTVKGSEEHRYQKNPA